MGLLDVSLADLGDYLYVAQTTISKWKTGARLLKPTSQHFGGIVEYFTMLLRDTDRRAKMEQLFLRLYPEQPLSSQAAYATCIRAFLSGKMLPSMTVQRALSEEGRLYTAQVGVYRGAEGCAIAMEQLLGFLSDRASGTVLAAERRDPQRAEAFSRALSAGHRLRLLTDMPSPSALVSRLGDVLAHTGTEVCLLEDGAPFLGHTASYVLEQELALTGHAWPGEEPYCAIHTDAETVAQQAAAFAWLRERTRPAFETLDSTRLGPELYQRAQAETLPERLDWMVSSLPYLTMSRELLMEVLRANDVSGRTWSHVLAGYDALEGIRLRLLMPAGALGWQDAPLPCLSLICGGEIRMTREQAGRHLLDTAARLRVGEALEVIPVSGEVPLGWGRTSPFVKRNAFAGYLNCVAGSVRVSDSPALVERFMQAADLLVSGVTEEARGRQYVAGRIEQAALS